MPRHRKDHLPRHRAGRPVDNSSRHGQFSAAATQGVESLRRSAPAVEGTTTASTAPPAEDGPGTHTVPLERGVPGSSGASEPDGIRELVRSRRRHDKGARTVGNNRQGQPWTMRAVAREVLVTPWFAAGTAVVIAAALWLTAPHARLNLASPIDTQPCTPAHCAAGTGEGTGTPRQGATGTLGHGRHVSPPRSAARTVSGVTVSYHVLWQRGGRFSAVITLMSKHSLGRWKVSFRIPGAHIQGVVGASWKRSAADAGTARALPADQPPGHGGAPGFGSGGPYAGWPSGSGPDVTASPGQSSSDSSTQNGSNLAAQFGSGAEIQIQANGQPPGGDAGHSDQAWFVIEGTGSAKKAVGCLFDGESCSFR